MTQAEQITGETEMVQTPQRPLTNAERELQELLELARSLGVESDEDSDPDASAVQAVAELGLDQPVEVEETPVAAFLTDDEDAKDPTPDAADVQSEDAAWFAINTYTGYEKKVRESLDLRIRNFDVADEFVPLNPEAERDDEKQYVLVPTQQEVEIRGGKRREVERMLLPGYVLVQVRVDPETLKMANSSWHVVTGTDGVTNFVGAENQARPLPADEVASIIGQTQVEEPRVRVGFAIDDSVRVTDGPFQDFIAQVDQINVEKGKVRVLISMFGRETPVELDFDQVEKQ